MWATYTQYTTRSCPVAHFTTKSCPVPTCACQSVADFRPRHGAVVDASVMARDGLMIQLCPDTGLAHRASPTTTANVVPVPARAPPPPPSARLPRITPPSVRTRCGDTTADAAEVTPRRIRAPDGAVVDAGVGAAVGAVVGVAVGAGSQEQKRCVDGCEAAQCAAAVATASSQSEILTVPGQLAALPRNRHAPLASRPGAAAEQSANTGGAHV